MYVFNKKMEKIRKYIGPILTFHLKEYLSWRGMLNLQSTSDPFSEESKLNLTDKIEQYVYPIFENSKKCKKQIIWEEIFNSAENQVKEDFPEIDISNISYKKSIIERKMRRLYAKAITQNSNLKNLPQKIYNKPKNISFYTPYVKKFRMLLRPEIWEQAIKVKQHEIFQDVIDIIGAMSIFIYRDFENLLLNGTIIPPGPPQSKREKDKKYVTFTWNELFETYKYVKDIKGSLNMKQRKTLQRDLFTTFLSSTCIYSAYTDEGHNGGLSDIAATFSNVFPGAEILTIMSTPLLKEHITADLMFENDPKITGMIIFKIIFPIYDIIKSGTKKSFKEKGVFNRYFSLNVIAQTKKKLISDGFGLYVVSDKAPISVLVRRIRSLELAIINSLLGVPNFIFQSMWLNLETFCNFVGIADYFQNSRYNYIKQIVLKLNAFFRSANFGRFAFDNVNKFTKNSNIYLDLNPEAVNSNFNLDEIKDMDWSEKHSFIARAINNDKLTEQEVYEKLEKNATIKLMKRNVVSSGLGLLTDRKIFE